MKFIRTMYNKIKYWYYNYTEFDKMLDRHNDIIRNDDYIETDYNIVIWAYDESYPIKPERFVYGKDDLFLISEPKYLPMIVYIPHNIRGINICHDGAKPLQGIKVQGYIVNDSVLGILS